MVWSGQVHCRLGGFRRDGTSTKREVSKNSMNVDRRGEGVKNPEIFADVLNGSPLMKISFN